MVDGQFQTIRTVKHISLKYTAFAKQALPSLVPFAKTGALLHSHASLSKFHSINWPLSPPAVQSRFSKSCCRSRVSDSLSVPPRTIEGAVLQAKKAIRRYREDKSAGIVQKPDPSQPFRAVVELPLPQPGESHGNITMHDEGEWPGGIQQKFRALKPLVDSLLFGYDAEFVGMLEYEEEGVGVWKTPDTTVVANVMNATFEPFARLCMGEFGSKPTEAGHTLLAVNPGWSTADDIGQLWDRELKRRARLLIHDAQWDVVFMLRTLRTSQGACGLLLGTYPGDWRLFAVEPVEGGAEGDCLRLGSCLYSAAIKPRDADIAAMLGQEQNRLRALNPSFADRLMAKLFKK